MVLRKKNDINDLALFGGSRLFASPRPIGQLAAPGVDDFIGLVRQSFDADRLYCHGPLEVQLEAELAKYHEVAHCVALANAGLGLMLLTRILAEGRCGEVILPAFTFRGLPHFVQWAGQMPKFSDVDRQSHTLELSSVERCINENTTSILAVCNFNSPGDIHGLCKLAKSHELPVFFDSVYAEGCTYDGKKLGGFGSAEVYSLHATKLLNGFEGGYVTTNDGDLADSLRRLRDGAMPTGELLACPALNARLNALHVAMGLLSLRQIDKIIERNRERFKSYQQAIQRVSGLSLIPYRDDKDERSNYEMAVLEVEDSFPLSRDQLMKLVRTEGLAIGPYYSPPLHRSEHSPEGVLVESMPNTEWLAGRYMQLPVGELVSTDDIERIGDLLEFVAENGESIAEGMKSRSVC